MSLILAVIPLFVLIILTNVAEARADPLLQRVLRGLMIGLNLLVFLFGLLLLFINPEALEAGGLEVNLVSLQPAGVTFLAMAIWGLVVMLPEVRRWLARWLPLDPLSPVHALALMLSGYLVGNSLLSLSQGGLENLAETAVAVSIVQVVATQALFLFAAITGVGLLIRRDWPKVIDRLGLEPPTIRQLFVGIGWMIILIIVQSIAGGIWILLNPEQAELLDNVNMLLLGDIDTAWEWFLLALAAGVGEELLFRGALQPVLGLWLTAFIFAFAHVQYGLTPATGSVFVIGLVLGLIRRRNNTTIAVWVHFGYNFILGLVALMAPYLEEVSRAVESILVIR